MKFVLIVEDTPKGISCKVAHKPSEFQNHQEQSLAAATVANWATQLRDMNQRGLIYIEKE